MKIALFTNTPAQVHFIKNIARILTEKGHNVIFLSREYGETPSVLNELKISHISYSHPNSSKVLKIINFPIDIINAYLILKKWNPDLIFGFGINETYTGLLLRKPVLIFTDTEPSANKLSLLIQYNLLTPFVTGIITPNSFRKNFGVKHFRVNSYKELAYLHPNYYSPNDDILDILKIPKGDKYSLLRFNAFDAVHDVGANGFSNLEKIKLVKLLENFGKVLISSENEVPNEIMDRVANIPKSRIHDVLYFAQLVVADSGTIVTEAAILGTPAILMHPLVQSIGNHVDFEKQYGLIYCYEDNPEQVRERAVDLLNTSNLKEIWGIKKNMMLEGQIDIAEYIVWMIENFPESIRVRSE